MSWPLILVLISTFLTAGGQVLWKIGSTDLAVSVISFFTNGYIWAGIFCYMTAAVFLIFALRKEQLSVVYPILSVSYVWILLASWFLLHEHIGLLNMIGMGLIMGGIICLGLGSNRSKKANEVTA